MTKIPVALIQSPNMRFYNIMKPGQTTDKPLAHLYGNDREVTKYGRLFIMAEDLLDACQTLIDAKIESKGGYMMVSKIHEALRKAKEAVEKLNSPLENEAP